VHDQEWVYTFGNGHGRGSAADRNLLGGKGANLAEMSNLGLPVPPGFTITTEVCTWYYDTAVLSRRLEGAVEDALKQVGGDSRARVRRSRKPASGLGPLRRPRLDAGHDGHGAQSRSQRRNGEGVGAHSGDERFAYDSYRRFIQMYADVVMGSTTRSSRRSWRTKGAPRSQLDTDVSADDGARSSTVTRRLVEEELGKPFPQDPHEQLWGAIGAVFGSAG
jgi:pyruvate,orthophosphate dikinase